MAKRIQRKRTRGWEAPLDEYGRRPVYVGRGSRFGNPFRVYRCDCCGYWDVIDDNGVTYHVDHAVARGETQPVGIVLDPTATPPGEVQRREATVHAVELFRQDIEWETASFTVDQIRSELAGRDLMCWCRTEDDDGNPVPCHGDLLLEWANGGEDRG